MLETDKIEFIDLSVCNRNFDSIDEEISNAKISFGYLEFLAANISPQIIRLGNSAEEIGNFKLFKYNCNGFLKILRFLKSKDKSIILFHGFTFPISFLFLNFFTSKDRKWIIQHHAEQPSKNKFKLYIQKIAYSKANVYLFVDHEQANVFLKQGIIKSIDQVFEVIECSTSFKLKEKLICRLQLGIKAQELVFIYVSGLDQNKDPMCLLKAMLAYREKGNEFSLYMFYNKNNLLPEVQSFINENQLNNNIFLKGNIENSQLENWYNAVDFYISCSHSEAMGVALAEAMACGCIPIVSTIPSFKRMTDNGAVGKLFEKGNSNELLLQLDALHQIDIVSERIKTNQLFKKNISFKAIGNKMSELITHLHAQL